MNLAALFHTPFFPEDPGMGVLTLSILRAVTALLATIMLWKISQSSIMLASRYVSQYRCGDLCLKNIWRDTKDYWLTYTELKIGVVIVAGLAISQIMIGVDHFGPHGPTMIADRVNVLNLYALLFNVSLELIFFGLSKSSALFQRRLREE